ncbi:MAG: ATP synthase F1 subunit epsilon [Gemmataceae bacterium]|nr:ATP synthase F1 subunit epsilon [Gemmataceae bacterium]
MASTPVTEPTVQSAIEHSLMPSIVTEQLDKLKGQVRLIVVTPEKAVFDGGGEFAVLPMYDGELGVLPGRAPLIGRLGSGELRLKAAGGTTRFFVESGFAQVRDNVVTVLTARAVDAAKVTPALAEQAAAEAAALPFATAVERTAKAKARDKAQGMKKVLGRTAAAGAATAHVASPGSHPV